MTIQELADRANVTPRTIRYYVEQGILPPPGRGRPAEYTDEHIKVLDLVRRLKEQYLPLEEIRSMLQSLSVEQLEDFLKQTGPAQQPEPERDQTGSAADYISRVLNRGTVRNRLQQEAPGGSLKVAESGMNAYAAPPSPAPLPYAAPFDMESAPTTFAAPAAAAAAGAPQPAMPVMKAAPNESAEEGLEAETWQRTILAPGIELHYRPPKTTMQQTLLERLLDAARRIVARNDVRNE